MSNIAVVEDPLKNKSTGLLSLTPPSRLLQNTENSSVVKTNTTSVLDTSKDVDWSCLSGRVKAQGNCGACYAFTTVDNVGAILGIYHFTFYI